MEPFLFKIINSKNISKVMKYVIASIFYLFLILLLGYISYISSNFITRIIFLTLGLLFLIIYFRDLIKIKNK